MRWLLGLTLVAVQCTGPSSTDQARLAQVSPGMNVAKVRDILGSDMEVCQGEGALQSCLQLPMGLSSKNEEVYQMLHLSTDSHIKYPASRRRADRCKFDARTAQIGLAGDRVIWLIPSCFESYVTYDVSQIPQAQSTRFQSLPKKLPSR